MSRLLEKMKKLATKLPSEEQDAFLEFMAQYDDTEPPPTEPVGDPPAEPAEPVAPPADQPAEPSPADLPAEPPPIEPPAEAQAETGTADPPVEPAPVEPAPSDPPVEDTAIMVKGEAQADDEEMEDNVVADDEGENMPIDSGEIADAQNAKTMALEAECSRLRAENERLKAKVEGAFGYSSKTTAPVKVNRLYDNNDVPKLHK